ncbi:MAG: hypothetical protein Q4B88_05825 [Moraxella sp.]|nr:hypothetical protein [Moraxella sp.]
MNELKANDEIYETYKHWDMSNAKKGNTNPVIQKIQQAKANFEKLNQLSFKKE